MMEERKEMMEDLVEMMEMEEEKMEEIVKEIEEICLPTLCLSLGLTQDTSDLCLFSPKCFIAPIISCFLRDPVCQQEPGF